MANIAKIQLPSGDLYDMKDAKALPLAGGTLTNTDNVFYTAPGGTAVTPNATSIIQSPIPKYLWHDVVAFCRATVPKYYTTTDGSTWTEATLNKNVFAQKENWGEVQALTSTITGSRWTWLNGGFYASSISWLVLGITYHNPSSHYNVLLETSSDSGSTWETLMTKENLANVQCPIWIRISGTCRDSIRLTITNNSASSSGSILGICAIKILTSRWGNQGKGSEYEYPYDWDGDRNVTFAGKLTVGTAPTNSMDVATKGYVDSNTSSATNWLNGSADGSVRTKNSAAEDSTYTIGDSATAEGNNSKAIGGISHAEGSGTTAQGVGSHTEGLETRTTMKYAHAEGSRTTASGTASHAEGSYSTASGYYSHAEGVSTVANHKAQHVFGECNIADSSAEAASARGTYVEIVGNGTADNARSNARTLDWNGNEVLAGKLTVGAAPTNNMDVATKQYVDSKADTKTWGGVALGNSRADTSESRYIVQFDRTSNTDAITSFVVCQPTPFALGIPKWDGYSYLYANTPSANDNSTKVATTAYVDAAIPDVSGYVSKSGDTMTGQLILADNHTSDRGLRINYNDNAYVTMKANGYNGSSSDYIIRLELKSGSTKDVILQGIATPSANTDAANKKYVDDKIPKVYSSTNTGGYLTMATLPIYDGTVV